MKVDTVERHYQWQMDLADLSYMEQYNSGFKYLLVIIDSYSRCVWVEKLKRKDSISVEKKLKKIITENDVVLPQIIQSDRGGEFNLIKKNCKSGLYGKIIKYKYSENYEMKSVLVERAIRTLKMMIANVIYKISGKRRSRYTNILDMIIERYNKSPHMGIDNNTPDDIYVGNKSISLAFKYKNNFDFSPLYKKNSILKKNSKVRVSKLKNKFDKETVFNWSTEIFFMHRVRLTNPVTYITR